MRFFLWLLLCSPLQLIQAQTQASTLAEWDSLGYTLAELFNEQNEDMDYYFDPVLFWERAIIGNTRQPEIRRLNEELLEDASNFKFSSIFISQNINVAYKFLRSRADSTLIVRQRINELEFSYLIFKLDYLQQEWKVVDIYFMVYDNYLSTMIQNTWYYPTVFEALGRDNAATILANSNIYREAKHLFREGEAERAYIKLSGIPLEERLHEYQVYKIFLAVKVEEEAKLLRSVEEYRQRFKQEKNLPLLFTDYYILTEDYDLAQEAINHIDSAIGGDNHLQFYKGLLYYLQDDYQKSVELMEEALFNDPASADYIAYLIATLVEHKDYRKAVQVLDKLVDRGYYSTYDLEVWVREEFRDFYKKGVFRRWLRQQYRS